MPSFNVSVPHVFSQEEATSRLKRLLEMAKERNSGKVTNLVEEWNGNQMKFGFSTFGFNVSGDVDVEPKAVKIQATIPFAAMMFKGKIEQTLRDELGRVLS